MQNIPTGVILLNMGGPTQTKDVRPFLYNLFSDREIIPLGPRLMQKPLAWLIAKRRAPKSAATYERIGGGSPLKQITEAQAEALEKSLQAHGNFTVTYAMRYWPPYCDEALDYLLSKGVERLVALSLYPHYSKATTGSSLTQLHKTLKKKNISLPLTEIPSWPKQRDYIAAIAANIKKGLATFHGEKTEIVYSAHSLPTSFIEAGDPYVEHTKQSIGAIEEITGKRGRLCFQSKSGPVEWLEPSTPDVLIQLAQEGVKNILMVPISFVSDHVETLYEIDILYKKQAKKLGMRLTSCPSLNTQEQFITGLRQLVLESSVNSD
ncbi:ferrochelatase [Desulfotalea psychrophila]|uniref:Ferrochelatase n=1 Tax=Desulfotalea psychrophila (strain LSv54 / DSM 12343) TaxID=177439 RepID=HEMH_DESPS|nr:ferrochelatase [Desulfotalea psychrophila]Q6APB0.1 RecName: Full=Ferrochelatase; AltName: Full=Heme synthase; AltName: Full=Protoheme ferro-lyase [Desulfotalea psychrophila LSv54]CAG35814.1 probable ferrochelatase [Desulfotalea psychrophila LSv54]